MDTASALMGAVLALGFMGLGLALSPTPKSADDAYAEFRDGQAQVVTYTVPGQGKCKAVMVNGERRAEKCEGE